MIADYSNKTVLIIDNSPVITRLIKNNMVEMGFGEDKLTMVNAGNQASMFLDLQQYDLVTTSIHLKALDGIDILKALRASSDEKTKNTPFIIISAERKEYFIEDLEKLGSTHYLQKPFTKELLQQALCTVFYPDLVQASTTVEKTEEASPPSAPLATSSAPLNIDIKIINPFIESTVEALGQYMAQAVAGEPTDADDVSGDFSSVIDITDKSNGVKSRIILFFPKDVACKIYAGIFGEVDLEQVCGVVQELGNIIAGIVKPKISECSQDIYSLIYPGQTLKEENGGKLSFQLGLPVTTMKDNHRIFLDNKDGAKFVVPFNIDQDKISLLVQFQKYCD
jgi:two-component system chemotaxis response regulator CheY